MCRGAAYCGCRLMHGNCCRSSEEVAARPTGQQGDGHQTCNAECDASRAQVRTCLHCVHLEGLLVATDVASVFARPGSICAPVSGLNQRGVQTNAPDVQPGCSALANIPE